MESLINRYRNITILVLVVLAQLVLLAVQVRNDQDVRMIRVWSVTAVTPLARALEGLRTGTFGVVQNYFLLHEAHTENVRMKAELDKLKMENVFLKAELATADRAKALAQFQSHTPSRTLPARVIGTGAGANSKLVFLDRGSSAGVKRGMGVVTPDGIVGKILQAYPTASEVLLVTDPDFAAGVVSQVNRVRGTLKGQGYANVKLDYVPNEEKLQVGEWLYTSGDDRIFPKGFPAGVVRVARPGHPFQEITVEPAGLRHGLEEVLVLMEGVHQDIPEAPAAATPIYIAPAPPATPGVSTQVETPSGTEADKLLQRYKAVGEAQGHKFGEGLPGSKPPDFNFQPKPATAPGPAAPPPQQAAPVKPGPRQNEPAPAETTPEEPAPPAAKPKPAPAPETPSGPL